MDAEESHLDGEQDATDDNDFSGHQRVSSSVPFEPFAHHHAPILDHSTPREDGSTSQFTENSDIGIFDKVVVSYLLRHFKQGPGQWYVSKGVESRSCR